jgi:uncharacterized protein (TIGR02246 family)
MIRFSVVIVVAMVAATSLLRAQEQDPRADDEAAIRKNAEAYAAAFNSQDAKALAAMWSPEAVYGNPLTGEEVVGRDAISRQFERIFSALKGAKLEATVESVQFVSPNVAIENGTARVAAADGATSTSAYSAVHVKRDGKWLLDRVSEKDAPAVASHHDKLKQLEWMIGSWLDEDDEAAVEMNCQWSKNQNFLIRTFTASVGGQTTRSGLQVIGWDAAAKQIRSWVFDSDGGFGDAVWTKKDKDNVWYIHAKDVSADGKKSSSQNILTVVDENAFTWQSVDRQADGQMLPNVDEVVVKRVAAGE